MNHPALHQLYSIQYVCPEGGIEHWSSWNAFRISSEHKIIELGESVARLFTRFPHAQVRYLWYNTEPSDTGNCWQEITLGSPLNPNSKYALFSAD
jgi:hypothetical protein